ncbi:hypothetical protein [Erythrobacter sp. BLCC-B19]|uniref:hypothetical protein n=1 Tax=Erythrobacter sp. BLCC-B19 TaxID=3025315 RepID=UPI00235F44B5|nr:hypothetical protein [Erythrobacter sp. BLCC-B19]WDA41512.1 hypothetical protein PS060_01500 [Erythrobacter sp. BLCC-B19]
MSASDHAPLPPLVFTVAITGHQDIPAGDHPALIAAVDSVLAEVAGTLKDEQADSPLDQPRAVSLRFVSALAPGADQIGARAAVLPERAAQGWQLEAILPFAIPVAQAAARAALDKRNAERQAGKQTELAPDEIAGAVAGIGELADKAARVLELADWQPSGVKVADDAWQSRRFATIGQMLVRRADLMIALWDGHPPRGRGGTADVVTEALQSGVPVVWIVPRAQGAVRSLMPDQCRDAGTASDVVRALPLASERNGDEPGDAGPGLAVAHAARQVMLGHSPARATCIARFLEERPTRRWSTSAAARMGEPPVPGDTYRAYALMLYLMLRWPRRAVRARSAEQEAAGASPVPLRSWPLQIARRDRGGDRGLGIWRSVLLYPFGFGIARDTPGTANAAPLLDHAEHADALATRLSNQYRSAYVWIFMLAPLAVTCAVLSAFLLESPPWAKPALVMLELYLVGTATYTYLKTRADDPVGQPARRRGLARLFPRSQDTHQRWMDARLIAESQRSGQLLAWVGFSGRRPIEAAPDDAHTAHEGHHGPRTVWAPHFANAIAALPELPGDEEGGSRHAAITPPRIAALARAAQAVIDDQHVYHDINHQRLEALNHRLDTFSLRAIQWAAGFSVGFMVLWAGYKLGLIADPSLLYTLKNVIGYVAAFSGAVLPALAAAAAGIRFQGDFERFAMRSKDTATALKALSRRARQIEAVAEGCKQQACAGQPPLFEPLLDVLLDTQAVLDEDLADWRFAYAARPIVLG